MQVISVRPTEAGWAPLDALATLAARLLDADLDVVRLTRLRKLVGEGLSRLPRRRRGGACLIIAPTPQDLRALTGPGHLLLGYGYVAAWVIDSFWPERAPTIARGRTPIDRFFVTDAEYVDAWASLTKAPVSWLPWGADVLGAGSASGDRPVDLQRMGRQPPAWEDDAAVGRLMAAAGLSYRGRPPFHADPAANQAEVMRSYRGAKFTVAFTNRCSPAGYTHPTHEYLTARWTDALAGGASVVGVPPRCRATEELLWPQALVELPGVDPGEAVPILRDEVAAWTPARAVHNHQMALERLDWRWRLRDLAGHLGGSFPRLEEDLAAIDRALGRTSAPAASRQPSRPQVS